MVSTIIQKEKERQILFLGGCSLCCNNTFSCVNCQVSQDIHQQSLINLKEYLDSVYFWASGMAGRRHQLKEDIEELNQMIEKYA